MSRKERHFQGITREIRNFPKILISEEYFVSTNFVFREYCFGEENSLSLTEFSGKLGEFCEKSVTSHFFTQIIGREELTEFSSRNSARAKKPH